MSKAAQKGSILRREIHSQPDVLARILERESTRAEALARTIARRDPRVVLVVARGSADNAGRYGKYLFGALNRKMVALATPSLFTQYRSVPDVRDALVIAKLLVNRPHRLATVVTPVRYATCFVLPLHAVHFQSGAVVQR